jgi:MEDS: MEthanogen/methylotroph, DcmR Sensory domain
MDSSATLSSTFTNCGLPGVSQVPYGTHMCHFYRDREELVAALVPFFVAGLSHNERCIWITAEPLDSAEARLELQKTGLDVAAAVRSGALTIRDYPAWYSAAEGLKSHQVAKLWLDEEERALAEGYSGLRITGNVSFLTPETWPDFMDYEEVVHQAFHGRRILSLCSYHALRCEPAHVLEVVRRHSCALTRPDDGWQVLTGFSN